MAEERGNGRGGKSVAAAGIIALILMLGGGGYFGFGPGKGQDAGSGGGAEPAKQEAVQEAGKEAAKEAAPESQAEAAAPKDEVPDVIVVTIKEDKVTINGHEAEDQEQLRQYVEEYNSDGRTFTLEEEKSILETYNWVKAVFDELDIQLKNSK